jgi:hypothetical protein
MKIVTLLSILFLSACTPFSAITTALSVGEASKAVKEDKQQPTKIETTIKKEGGEVVVSSTSERSIVASPKILEPINKPRVDIEKGLGAIPLWLILVAIASGILLFINMLRHRRNNNKGACHDTDRNWQTESPHPSRQTPQRIESETILSQK